MPQLGQVVDVGLQFFVAGGLRAGADDVAAGIFGQQGFEAGTQFVAFFFVFDALGNADVVVLRQIHEKAAGQGDLGGKARAFAVNRVFNHLHQDGLPFKQHMLDALGFLRLLPLFEHVHDVQKGGALQADVDKGALHTGQHAFDHAQINIAHQPVAAVAVDVQLAHFVFFQQRHAGFLRRYVHQNGFRRAA